jgi:hypothetical protein
MFALVSGYAKDIESILEPDMSGVFTIPMMSSIRVALLSIEKRPKTAAADNYILTAYLYILVSVSYEFMIDQPGQTRDISAMPYFQTRVIDQRRTMRNQSFTSAKKHEYSNVCCSRGFCLWLLLILIPSLHAHLLSSTACLPRT